MTFDVSRIFEMHQNMILCLYFHPDVYKLSHEHETIVHTRMKSIVA